MFTRQWLLGLKTSWGTISQCVSHRLVETRGEMEKRLPQWTGWHTREPLTGECRVKWTCQPGGLERAVVQCLYPRWVQFVVFSSSYTAILRTVVGKNVHATIPKGDMGYDQYTLPDDCSCRTYFCRFPLALANICPWPPVPFFQISLKNRTLKTTHNTLRDCRVHIFRQPFSK